MGLAHADGPAADDAAYCGGGLERDVERHDATMVGFPDGDAGLVVSVLLEMKDLQALGAPIHSSPEFLREEEGGPRPKAGRL